MLLYVKKENMLRLQTGNCYPSFYRILIIMLLSRPFGSGQSYKVCRPTPPDDLGPFYRPNPPPLLQKCPICRGTYRQHHLIVRGKVFSDDCVTSLPNMIIELWQADQFGRYDTAPDLRGFIRTDTQGYYEFTTVRPGNYRIRGYRPAHIHYYIPPQKGHRGLVTQMYFSGDPFLGRNDSCDICNSYNTDLHVTVMDGACDHTGFCMDSVWFPIILARGYGVSILRPNVLQRRRQMKRRFLPKWSRPVVWEDLLLPRRFSSSSEIYRYVQSPRNVYDTERYQQYNARHKHSDTERYQQYNARHKHSYYKPNPIWRQPFMSLSTRGFRYDRFY